MDQMSPLLSAIAENAILSCAELSAGTSKRIALTANSSESLVCIFKFKINNSSKDEVAERGLVLLTIGKFFFGGHGYILNLELEFARKDTVGKSEITLGRGQVP